MSAAGQTPQERFADDERRRAARWLDSRILAEEFEGVIREQPTLDVWTVMRLMIDAYRIGVGDSRRRYDCTRENT